MPQNTNLNVSPYFDDFDENKNFKRVLFKPGTPIQSRELTTLQSILQNQIDRFGQHFFKEGSKVIPGQTSYDNRINFIRLEPLYLGTNTNLYVKELVGKTIIGQTSGVRAEVELSITDIESTVSSNTLYIRYTSSSTTNFEIKEFQPGETLVVTSDITYNNDQVIVANSPFATVIQENHTGNASIAAINEGVYFIRGHFVKIQPQKIILNQYSQDANSRVGLLVEEDIVTSYDDDTLNDNAQGFSNYAAPGADRLKIAATLIKKDLDDYNDENFIELMRIINGDRQKFKSSKTSEGNENINNILAKRTYDESGNYIVKPFEVFVKENLNDGLGNEGIYYDFETTPSGLEPSEDSLTIKISPGKAYVEGYEIEKISPTLIDIPKPRTSAQIPLYSLTFNSAASVTVDNVYGTPRVGLTTSDVVQLSDSRIDNSSPSTLPGTQIGVARIYDFVSEEGYEDDTSKFECYLYDIQTYTAITVGVAVTISVPARIEGRSSRASGYLVSSVTNSKNLTLYNTKGNFLINEPIILNGIDQTYDITAVKDYDFKDVKSIRSVDGGTSQVFTADLRLRKKQEIADKGTRFTITSGGTVTIGITTETAKPPVVGDIVSYTKIGNPYPTFNKITAVAGNLKTFTVVGISSVTGVVDGTLPSSDITVNNLVVVRPTLKNYKTRDMFEELPHDDISALDLTNSKLEVRKTYIANVSSNTLTVVETDVNLFFKAFDIDYTLSYTDGTVENIRRGQVSITNGGKTLTITQLSKASSSNAKLIATLEKINVTSKKKNIVRCATLTINRSALTASGTGGNTLNDGLTYSSIYGTRVQDRSICLNVPDVIRIQDIYESYDTNNPVLPSMVLEEIIGDLTSVSAGQVINGKTSLAKAKVVSTTSTTVTFVYVNELTFQKGEVLDFINSDIEGKVLTLNQYSKDISDKYKFDSGARAEFVDYGRIRLKAGQEPPSKKITIVFDYYTTPSGDQGDFTSFSSFDFSLYTKDIPYVIKSLRATDAIDIRPRVKQYDPLTATLSPFEFNARDFNSNGASVLNPIVNGTQIELGYSHYLGRIDVLYLHKNGNYEIKSGAPADNPQKPLTITQSIDIATITLPPYVYNSTEVIVAPIVHKRYTMKDIERLEVRIENIEKLTSLTLLESNTKNMTIKDAKTGLDRFKSGFFVDSFNNHNSHTISHPDFKASIDAENGILRPSHYTTCLDLACTRTSVTTDGVNVKKKGELITLDYEEVALITQPFATRVENVNPFSIVTWNGKLELSPSSDTWFDEKKLKVNTVEQEGNYEQFLDALNVDPNTGFSPVDWGAWETAWSGKELVSSRIVSREKDTIFVPTQGDLTKNITGKGKDRQNKNKNLK
jgi:hypothetical protein